MNQKYRLGPLAACALYSFMSIGQSVDPRGPISAYARVEVTPQGVSLPDTALNQKSDESQDKLSLWTPQWISLPDDNQHSSAIRLRKEFALPINKPISHAIALMTADPFYRLWINGHLVSRGPDDAGSDYSPRERWSKQWLANRVDVKNYLRPGQNVITAEVFRHHRNLSRSALGFAFRLKLAFDESSEPILIETGPDWLVDKAAAYSTGAITEGDVTESDALLYDARKDNPDWRELMFSTTGWVQARVIDSVWGPVAISSLPPMMEAAFPPFRMMALDGGSPPALVKTLSASSDSTSERETPSWSIPGNGKFIVDYDRVLSGYVSLKLRGIPGTTLTVWPRELRSDAPGRRPFSVILGTGVTYFESPSLESFSSLEIDVSLATGPLNLEDVRANFVSQPVVYRGAFTSNDEKLNTLWLASRWQTQICLQNRFLDSPDHQEPIGDPGDYLIEARVADDAFGSPQLTPQFLREFAKILDHWMADHPDGAPNFHTSYSLLWLQTLLEYYDETGDQSLAKELAPSAYRLLARYAQWIGPNNILSEAPNYLFMDWVTIGGFQTHHPPAVIGQGYLTALYYRGLADGMRLAKISGDADQLAHYATQRRALYRAFNRELWDARTGLYRDGKPFLNHNPTSPDFLPPDKDIETHSPHVNVLAVLYDLAPRKRQPQILARLLASKDPSINTHSGDLDTKDFTGLNVQPYFMHFVFAAEAHAGVLSKYAFDQLARWNVNPQTQTFEEMWTRGDWSHGWGATPLIQMSEHVLGVRAGSPGYSSIVLQPTPLALTFARGTVPTPKGDVQVSWTRNQDKFVYNATIPPHVHGIVDLSNVAETGRRSVIIDDARSKTYRGPFPLESGPHQIVVLYGSAIAK